MFYTLIIVFINIFCDVLLILISNLFQCGGVTKEHYRQMVALDESNIELTWECPPCHKKNNPSPAPPSSPDEPPQQTVAKIPPRPKTKPSETIPVTAPKPSAMVPILPKPVPTPSAGARYSVTMTSNGVNKSQTNGVNDTPGRLSFPDVRIRDLPFYPVKATLLRPCVLTPKVKDSTVINDLWHFRNNFLFVFLFLGYTKSRPCILSDTGASQHSQ